jgi:hypothetical protein
MQCQCLVMKKLLKSAVCAVVNYQYYCEVDIEYPGHPRGIYTFSCPDHLYSSREYYHMVRISNKIWRQGPKGGVKITKDRRALSPLGYITNSEKHMKKFLWIKLQAKELA